MLVSLDFSLECRELNPEPSLAHALIHKSNLRLAGSEGSVAGQFSHLPL